MARSFKDQVAFAKRVISQMPSWKQKALKQTLTDKAEISDFFCTVRGYFHDSQEPDNCGEPAAVVYRGQFYCPYHAQPLIDRLTRVENAIKKDKE